LGQRILVSTTNSINFDHRYIKAYVILPAGHHQLHFSVNPVRKRSFGNAVEISLAVVMPVTIV
jgi:hypothetical protein